MNTRLQLFLKDCKNSLIKDHLLFQQNIHNQIVFVKNMIKDNSILDETKSKIQEQENQKSILEQKGESSELTNLK